MKIWFFRRLFTENRQPNLLPHLPISSSTSDPLHQTMSPPASPRSHLSKKPSPPSPCKPKPYLTKTISLPYLTTQQLNPSHSFGPLSLTHLHRATPSPSPSSQHTNTSPPSSQPTNQKPTPPSSQLATKQTPSPSPHLTSYIAEPATHTNRTSI